MQKVLNSECPLSYFNPSLLEKATSYASSVLQMHPILDYITNSLHQASFTQITNRYSYLKSLMGSEFSEFIDSCTLRCNTCLSFQRMKRKQWKDGVNQSYYDQLEDWSFFIQSYQEQRLRASPRYLETCSYLVQDPHMMKNDIRRKMMKIPPPAIHYGTRTEKETAFNTASTNNSNLHTILNIPLNRKEYDCMNTTIFDSKWGRISVNSRFITFYQSHKPLSAKGSVSYTSLVVDTVIPNMQAIIPMKPLQCYPLHSIEKVYLRRFYCQYSSIELFYRIHNHHDSVLLYFLDSVVTELI